MLTDPWDGQLDAEDHLLTVNDISQIESEGLAMYDALFADIQRSSWWLNPFPPPTNVRLLLSQPLSHSLRACQLNAFYSMKLTTRRLGLYGLRLVSPAI